MGHIQDNTKGRKWEQVKEGERYKIEALRKAKHSIREIAELMGRDRRTIQRELRRGEVRQRDTFLREREVYCADAGQRVREERAANKGRGVKIGHNHALAEYLEEKIVREHYSPDAALGELRRSEQSELATICTKTVYNYIDMGLFAGITNANLPVKRTWNPHRHRYIRKVALNNKGGRSISERDASIDTREELVRRFVPNGTDIGKLSVNDVKRAEYWMNHYPRKRFDFQSPSDRCTLGVLV
jgi:transposase, IS30 family